MHRQSHIDANAYNYYHMHESYAHMPKHMYAFMHACISYVCTIVHNQVYVGVYIVLTLMSVYMYAH